MSEFTRDHAMRTALFCTYLPPKVADPATLSAGPLRATATSPIVGRAFRAFIICCAEQSAGSTVVVAPSKDRRKVPATRYCEGSAKGAVVAFPSAS